MDLVTHALAGLTLARPRRGRPRVRGVTAILLTASLLPDIDVVWALADPTFATLERRTLTHSVPGILLISLVCAVLLRAVCRDMSFRQTFMLFALGMTVHVVFDVVTSFGVALLYPFSDYRFEMPLIFVIDPVLTSILIAGLAAPMLFRTKISPFGAAVIALGLVSAYLIVGAVARNAAREVVIAQADGAVLRPESVHMVPEPFAPFRWKAVYRVDDVYRQALVHPWSGTLRELATVRTELTDPRVQVVRRSPVAARIEHFFKLPVWRVGDTNVAVYDLRFRYATLENQWDPFGFRFRVTDGRVAVVRERFTEKLRRSLETLETSLVELLR